MKLNGTKDMIALQMTNGRGQLTINHDGHMTYRGETWTVSMPLNRRDLANLLAMLREAAGVIEDLNG